MAVVLINLIQYSQMELHEIRAMEFGKKLREHRMSLCINVELVSIDTGLSVCMINTIEEGQAKEIESYLPTIEVFHYMQLLEYYNLPVSFLFD